MAENSDQVVVGADGQVWVSRPGVALSSVTAPSDATTDPNTVDPDWMNLGYTSEEGATLTLSREIEDILAWQSFDPIRKIVTSRNVVLAFTLRQWNQDTVELATGGTVTGTAGDWELTPAAAGSLDERSLLLDWQDGASRSFRLYIPRGIIGNDIETNIVRTAAADLPIEFAAFAPSTGSIFTMFTNDNAFGPTGS